MCTTEKICLRTDLKIVWKEHSTAEWMGHEKVAERDALKAGCSVDCWVAQTVGLLAVCWAAHSAACLVEKKVVQTADMTAVATAELSVGQTAVALAVSLVTRSAATRAALLEILTAGPSGKLTGF